MEKLLSESELLKSLQPDESLEDLFISNPRIKESYDLALPIYEGNYPLNNIKLINYIKALAYLGCEKKVDELLIFLHFNYNKEELKFQMEENLLFRYDQLIPEKTIFLTFIRYDMISPFKYLNSTNNYMKNNTDFIQACKYGNLEIVIFLYSLGGVDIHANDDEAFKVVCTNGHLEILQRLIRASIRIDLPFDNFNILPLGFISACKYGYLEIVKILYELIFHDFGFEEEGFIEAIKNDHFEIAKWLYINSHEYIDFKNVDFQIRLENEFKRLVFSITQETEENIRWLYNLFIREKIEFNIDGLFNRYLETGFLQTSKFLYSLGGIDIHKNNDHLLKYPYSVDIKQWLRSLP